MSAASALAEKKNRVEKVFLNNKNELSKNGIYGVNFYTLGVPHTVIVDDYLPVYDYDGAGTMATYFAGVGKDGSIWGPILEKAFAKYHGNYKHIIGGVAPNAVKALYGAPNKTIYHTNTTAAKLWKELSAADKRGDIMNTGTGNAPAGATSS